MEAPTPPKDTEKTETSVSEQKTGLRVTDAIMLAIASAGAYLFSFLYERGYTEYFGIPQEFINVSLINLLIFGAAVVSFLWISFTFFDLIFPFIRPEHPYLAFYIPRAVR